MGVFDVLVDIDVPVPLLGEESAFDQIFLLFYRVDDRLDDGVCGSVAVPLPDPDVLVLVSVLAVFLEEALHLGVGPDCGQQHLVAGEDRVVQFLGGLLYSLL